jgi:hypothetical protein
VSHRPGACASGAPDELVRPRMHGCLPNVPRVVESDLGLCPFSQLDYALLVPSLI